MHLVTWYSFLLQRTSRSFLMIKYQEQLEFKTYLVSQIGSLVTSIVLLPALRHFRPAPLSFRRQVCQRLFAVDVRKENHLPGVYFRQAFAKSRLPSYRMTYRCFDPLLPAADATVPKPFLA